MKRAERQFWAVLQVGAIICTAIAVAALFLAPSTALGVLWTVVIPLLPATFLVSPVIWRSVCPLASANMVSNGWMSGRKIGIRGVRTSGAVGLILLAVLVPARHVWFNTDGNVLAVTIGAVVVLAVAAGAIFDSKAGFCNAICPVLPVEKLYGQSPLLKVSNPRCADCSLCTRRGCIDLHTTGAMEQVLGSTRKSRRWLLAPYGLFACAFPGFVYGYFQVSDGATLAQAYAGTLGWAALSYLTAASVIAITGLRSRYALPALGALAIGVYYWFAAPGLAEFVGLAATGSVVLRIALLAFVAFWLARALRLAVLRRDPPASAAAVPARLPDQASPLS